MTTAKICSFLLALTALAATGAAQDPAVYSPRSETRLVRVQPAMRHVGARLVVERAAPPTAREASMRLQLRQRLVTMPRVHFRS